MTAPQRIVAVGASLATPAEPAEHLNAFYERVRPPGFWGDAAARRRLWSSGISTLAAAGTLFTSLVGLGSWLVGSTPPGGLSPVLWIALNLCVEVSALRAVAAVLRTAAGLDRKQLRALHFAGRMVLAVHRRRLEYEVK